MVNDKMVNMKMYSKPQTETTPIKVVNTLCSSQTVGFGNGQGSGPALAPGRHIEDPKF
jgi:hypothetical protein